MMPLQIASIRNTVRNLFVCCLLAAFAGAAWAQEAAKPAPSPAKAAATTTAKDAGAAKEKKYVEKPPSYLPLSELTFMNLLPPFPVVGGEEDKADVATLTWWRRPVDDPRWKLAKEDAKISYSRFEGAYGAPIDEAHAPLLVHLLKSTLNDVFFATGLAKHYYHRQRPFERLGWTQVCWEQGPDGKIKGDDMSYPSGHNAYAWSTVLTLSAVAPELEQKLLARGVEYGESRMVCGVHYPTDVQGGKLVASSVFFKLQAVPAYQRDLRCAREERSVAQKSGKLDEECQQLLDSLTKKDGKTGAEKK